MSEKMSNEKLYITGNLCCLVTFAVIIRCSVSLHPYSGQNTPPMYGDYEAQRHWMEITVNLPSEEWYFNSTNNDLMYWGLDYPPLTAYHSYLNGKIAELIDPDFVKLFTSRGYESYNHKFFMRSTVTIAEILIYFSSVITFFNTVNRNPQKNVELKHGEMTETKQKINVKSFTTAVSYLAQIGVALLYPGLILIDHGHFQYNSVSLGFTISAVTALLYERFFVSSVFFCLALNYKQMSLYYSLPFFVYFLSHCFDFKKRFNIVSSFVRLLCISLTVITTFVIIWYPFLSYNNFVQVIQRLFPLSRGIFEDKVSNIWCVINIFIKINKHLSQVQLAKICIVCVLLTSFVCLLNLFKKPTHVKLLASLINVSLSFFLFSYQVHEKSILLVALPVTLFFRHDPLPSFWFLIISNFSMLPLYLKDNLVIPFVSLSVLFILFVFANVSFQGNPDKNFNFGTKAPHSSNKDLTLRKYIAPLIRILFHLSLSGCILLFIGSTCIEPPSRYPDLWPLLVSVYSCFHFCLFFLYFNYYQLFKAFD